jgi:hypothetical protein
MKINQERKTMTYLKRYNIVNIDNIDNIDISDYFYVFENSAELTRMSRRKENDRNSHYYIDKALVLRIDQETINKEMLQQALSYLRTEQTPTAKKCTHYILSILSSLELNEVLNEDHREELYYIMSHTDCPEPYKQYVKDTFAPRN